MGRHSTPVRALKIITFLLMGFHSFSTLSQENTLIKGKVVTDSHEPSIIHVVNLTQERGTTSSETGMFFLHAKVNDTLLFSSVQYRNLKVRITIENIENQELNVHLEREVNELEEVVISNHDLSGNLKRDIENIDMFDQAAVGFPYLNKTAPPPGSTARRIQSAGNSPVELLINSLNGNLKKLKKLQEMEKEDAWVDRGIGLIDEEFLTTGLLIPEEESWLFVYYCSKDSRYRNLVRENNPLSLMELLAEKADGYLTLRNEVLEALEEESAIPE